MEQLSKSARRFREALSARGHDIRIVSLSTSTRTAAEAAQTIGCSIAQIAKSIVFREVHGMRTVVVVASGENRVDVGKIEALFGARLEIADGNYVKRTTGYAIGGVPPAAHESETTLFLDRSLKRYDEIWAAAGTPYAVFRIDPATLEEITGAVWHDVAG